MLIILLPGLHGTGDLFFEPFLKCLPASLRTRIVSYPNHTYLPYAKLEDLVVRNLPATEKYIVIAESFSGPIALQIANRVPDNLQAVVLVSSFAYQPLGWIGLLLARLPLERLLRLPLPEVVLRTFLMATESPKADVKQVATVIKQVPPDVLARRLREVLTSTYGTTAIHTKVRVIAIVAKHDRLLGRRAALSIAKVCPHLEKEAVAAPHLALEVAPRAVLDLLQNLDVLSG